MNKFLGYAIGYTIAFLLIICLDAAFIWFLSYVGNLCFQWQQLSYWPQCCMLASAWFLLHKTIKGLFAKD